MPGTHVHTHSRRPPNVAPVEFVLWLIWVTLRPFATTLERVTPYGRQVLTAVVLVLIAVNLAWLAS